MNSTEQDKHELYNGIVKRTLRQVRDGTIMQRRSESHFLLMLAGAVTDQLWAQIVARAIVDAMDGDVQARNWLSKYLMGDTPTLVQAVQIEQVNQIGVNITDDRQAMFYTLGKLLNQTEDTLPPQKRDKYMEMVQELNDIIASSPENKKALNALAEKVGAPTSDDARMALYDVVTLVDEDEMIENVG